MKEQGTLCPSGPDPAGGESPAPDASCPALVDRGLSDQQCITVFGCLYEIVLEGGREAIAAAALLLKYKLSLHPQGRAPNPDAPPLVIRSVVVKEPEGDG